MALKLYDKLTPSGDFALVDAEDVLMPDGGRLSDFKPDVDVTDAVNDALAQAKESGMFDGADGQNGKDGKDGIDGINGKDGVNGKDGTNGQDGEDGKDGFSPVISVKEVDNGHAVSITDVTGTKTFVVMNGTDGEAESGQNGKDGFSPVVSVKEITGGHEISITDSTGTKVFEVKDGQNGQNGQNGFSPVIAVTEIDGGHRVSVTDATGTKTFNVMDGKDGKDGQDGSGGSGGLVSLPDSVPRIEDRASSMTFAETPEHHFDALSNSWWKVSDLVPTTEELLTTVFTIVFSAGGNAVAWTPTAEELLLDSEWFTGVQSAAYGAGFFVCRVSGEHNVHFNGADFELNIPSAGIYFGYPVGTPVPESVSVSVAYTELRKLDPRLLPDGFETIVNHYIDTYLSEALGGEY